jgi:hypothetical protein
MSKAFLPLTALCLAVSLTVVPALAQTAAPKPAKPRSPGEMAAIDLDKNEKRARCSGEAKAKKLHFLKRRNFIRDCMNPH